VSHAVWLLFRKINANSLFSVLEIEEVREKKGWMCPHCIEEQGTKPYWICNRYIHYILALTFSFGFGHSK